MVQRMWQNLFKTRTSINNTVNFNKSFYKLDLSCSIERCCSVTNIEELDGTLDV